MTTLFTVSKSEVMKNAANRYKDYKNTRDVKNYAGFAGLSNRDLLSKAVKYAWQEVKKDTAELNVEIIARNEEEIKVKEQKKSNKKSSNGRYVELLSIAEKNDLNHGSSWYASGNDIDSKQLHPSWEGEEICYVYAVA